MKRFLNIFKKKEKKEIKKSIGKLFKPSSSVKPTNSPPNTPNNSSNSDEKITNVAIVEKLTDKLVEKLADKLADRKKSILIGLNYPGSHFSLNGCVNDVKNGDTFLKGHGYESRFLADEDVSTKYDVLEALEELKNSDSKFVFFHYSGHGTQVDDKDKDELDGFDETVYSKDGHLITDDEINSKLAEFPVDKNVFLVFDCCHSGTIADLPYIAISYDSGVKEEKVKKPIKAKVICLSGCRDSGVSADISEKGLSYGALSSTFYSTLRKNEADKKVVSWKDLYQTILIDMNKKHYSQIPQLTASHPSLFDLPVQF
jgi:hypothetical protein